MAAAPVPGVAVLIVDDDPDMRALLRLVLADDDGVVVVGEANDGWQAVARVAELGPAVVVLDQSMPGLSGTQTAALIRRRYPEVGIVLFSAALGPSVVDEARAVGIDLSMSKMELDRVPRVVRQVASSRLALVVPH